jgi:CheY-like chemotaxis protein
MAKRTLEGTGYAVVEAADGEEALRIANRHADIDVIVTDLTMPRLSGGRKDVVVGSILDQVDQSPTFC